MAQLVLGREREETKSMEGSRLDRSSRSGRRTARAAVAAIALTCVAGVAACGSPGPSGPPTTTVHRGPVSTMVSGSGALASVTQQNIGFSKPAQLAQLNVKVGDQVEAGQVLAAEDPFIFQQALDQQQSGLDQLQAALDKILSDVSVPNAQRALDRARRSLDAVRDNRDAIARSSGFTVRQAKKAYDDAQDAYRAALHCETPPAGTTGGTTTGGATTAGTPSGGATTGGGAGTLLGGLGSAATSTASCPDPAAVAAAKKALAGAKVAYVQAKNAYDVAYTQATIAVRGAQSVVATAQNTVATARTGRPSDIRTARANLAKQASFVRQAQWDLGNTVLRAPLAGTVSAITGTVGEYVAGGAGTTALAPGTDAAIPGVGAAATSDQSGNAASGISATRPGGGAFIVLNNLNTFQVVVPFQESDAAKVLPNQKVRVTFDSLPDLERDGTVLSVSPQGVNISGVTNYYATILLTQSDPRLKAGQTAEASVVTSAIENSLVVPNAAVLGRGGQTSVNVLGPDGTPRRVPFTPGAVGDDNTQVLGGLREGQRILLPGPGPAPGAPGGS